MADRVCRTAGEALATGEVVKGAEILGCASTTSRPPSAGFGDGVYQLGRIEILVQEGRARLADGTIAGSTVALDQAVRNLVDLGSSIEEVVAAVTSVPARVLGRTDTGVLAVGAPADVVILDNEFGVIRVVLAGVEVDVS